MPDAETLDATAEEAAADEIALELALLLDATDEAAAALELALLLAAELELTLLLAADELALAGL